MTAPQPRPTMAERWLGSPRPVLGRDTELAQVAELLDAEDRAAVLVVHGPGGVGKSALLGEVARLADQRDRPVLRLDCADLDRSPAGVHDALRAAAGAAPDGGLPDLVPPEAVLLIDRFEVLGLEQWFWRTFVPALPADAALVVAGRQPPPPEVLEDHELRGVVETLSLRNLAPRDAAALLETLGVPDSASVEALAGVCHGHPLALVIAADTYLARGGLPAAGAGALLDHPDASTRLLGRFVDGAVTPLQRRALHLCGHTHRVDREMVGRVLELDGDAADAMLDWLRSRPYAEAHPDGLSVHDVVRDALDRDLRWRDPAAFAELHGRIREVVVDRLRHSTGAVQQRAAADILFLHRGNPLSRQLYALDQLGTISNRTATSADHAAVMEIVGRVDGAGRARAAAAWWERQPEAFHVHQEGDGTVVGVTAMARLDREADRLGVDDPVAAAAWAAITSVRPPEPGEVVIHQFIADGLTPGRIGPVADMIGALSLTRWTLPGLGWVVLSSPHEEGWAPLWGYIGFEPLARVDVDDAPGPVAVWARDFGRSPYADWLERMAAQELSDAGEPHPPVVTPIALSREDFGAGVRSLLRELHRPDRLVGHPLAGSRMVPAEASGRAAQTLQARVRQALAELEADPKQRPGARAVDRTYVRAAATQAAAAEVLGLPFSTYRRHLAAGVDRLTELLWHWELRGVPPLPEPDRAPDGAPDGPPDGAPDGAPGPDREVSTERPGM